MKVPIAILASAAISGCASLSHHEYSALKGASIEQDVATIKKLAHKANPDEAAIILGNLVESAPRCSERKAEAARELYDAGGRIRGTHSLDAAAKTYCPAIVEIAAAGATPEQLHRLTLTFLQKTHDAIRRRGSIFTSESDASDTVAVYEFLRSANKAACDGEEEFHPTCAVEKDFAALKASLAAALVAIKGAREREIAGGGALDRACAALAEAEEAQRRIDKEKEIGQVSGTVDPGRLNDAGRRLIAAKERLTAAVTEYISKTGKKVERENCVGH